MLVDQLALIVVFRVCLAIGASQCLRRFVSFETQIKLLLTLCLVCVSHALIAQHQVVVRLQVFRVYVEYPL